MVGKIVIILFGITYTTNMFGDGKMYNALKDYTYKQKYGKVKLLKKNILLAD